MRNRMFGVGPCSDPLQVRPSVVLFVPVLVINFEPWNLSRDEGLGDKTVNQAIAALPAPL